MKRIALLLALATATLTATAQTQPARVKPMPLKATLGTKWDVDPMHTSVKFTVEHLKVSEVEGRFKVFNGTIEAPAAGFDNAQISFTVDVASISTDNDTRDTHLKSDDFFNAEKYPKMTFVSTSFKKLKGPLYVLEGNLTIRDVTKKVKFNVYSGGTMKDPYGNTKAGFKATGKISRKDFNLKWNKMTEAGGAIVGDEVNMILNLEFTQSKS